jgi:hypothetical protein
MMSARPPNAPTGRPPPMILPRVVRSGDDLLDLLHAAAADAEAGHDLVENEHRAVGGRGLAQVLRGSRRRA